MKLIIRNLLHVIRRFKLATTLNILGLSVAFTAFMIIMMQLNFNFGFDRFHKDSDKIFRMEVKTDDLGGDYGVSFSRPLAEAFFESSPHIVVGAITRLRAGETFFHVEKDGTQIFFKETSLGVSPEFPEVFNFDFVEGREDALTIPGSVIIPLSLAHKLFGDESAVGKQLVLSRGPQTVGAVYRDFPKNSIVDNHIYIPIPENENRHNWLGVNYIAYIRVNDASNAPLLVDNFIRNFDFQVIFGPDYNLEEMGANMRLTALPDIHFTTDARWDDTPKSSRQVLMILFAIAIIIIVIASINFTNFSTALSPMRVKNINTRRVLGASQTSIRFALVFEAVAFSLVSYGIALLLVKLFADSTMANLVDADVSLSAHPMIVGGTALIALLAGLFAGFYPMRYMTSFAPALALKGNFALSPKGKQLRNSLIAIQFVASFALIIGASFMYLQNRFMQNSDLGFDKDALITTNIGRIQANRDDFASQIKSYAGIEGITFSQELLSSRDEYYTWGVMYRGEPINAHIFPVHHTFLKVLGIEISEGRDFRQEDEYTQCGVWIFNETARKQRNLELNTVTESWVGAGEIIGFVYDLKFASFRNAVEPMAFYVYGTSRRQGMNIAYIRLKEGANVRSAMSHIHATLAEFDPNYPFEVRFFDETLQQLYESERKLSSLILLFSLIAIFISIVGVFGLVVFDSECRRKEIGIRKILGASTGGIILMFNKAYFKILLICFVVATPLAWFAVKRWLENFAYKTPMFWWVYLLAFLAISAITVLTVTIQNWRVANDNPVKSIKTE